MDLNVIQYWLIAAFVLGVLEIFTGTFVLLFFALASILVAAAASFGLQELGYQLLAFALFSASGILVFRRKIKTALNAKGGFTNDKAVMLRASTEIPPHGTARIEYQGSFWTAENDSDRPILKGDSIEIVRAEGNRLVVRPKYPQTHI